MADTNLSDAKLRTIHSIKSRAQLCRHAALEHDDSRTIDSCNKLIVKYRIMFAVETYEGGGRLIVDTPLEVSTLTSQDYKYDLKKDNFNRII